MALPDLDYNAVDGNLGLVGPGAEKFLVVGPAAAGTNDVITTYAQPTAMVTAHTAGQGVTAGCHIIDVAKGSIDFLKCGASVAAANTAVTESGPAGPDVTVSGDANDFYSGIIVITLGGAEGVAKFKYSLDGGITYGAERIVPAGLTFAIPGTGVTATFTSGTQVVGTTHSWTSTPATFNASDLTSAMAAALAVNTRWKGVLFAGMSADAASAATLFAAIAGHLDDLADDFRLNRALWHMGDDSEANVISELPALEDLRMWVGHGKDRIRVANPIEGWYKPQLPNHYNAAAMVARFTRGTNIGWVGTGFPPNGGRKPRVSAISFDEGKQGEQLHNLKCNATRTYVGRSGYYWTNSLLKSPAGSDFRYLHWGLAFDRASEVALGTLQKYINDNFDVLSDGTGRLRDTEAARVDKEVNKAVREAVLEQQTDNGKTGFFSDAQFAVDRTDDALTNKRIIGDLRCVPKANTEQVILTAGLSASIVGDTDAQEEEAA